MARNGWQRVKFGEVVKNVTDTVRDPLAAGIERVVGLEHLDPGELAITRWASIENGTTFTRRFRAGQVLFGKRRAYQRKVAVPEFDGICSGDIYVFEPADDRLLPELLPFIVKSEPFFDRALSTSAGSLSPRTNWRDLSDFELELPPLDEQQELAELLWSAESVSRRLGIVERELTRTGDRFLEERIASTQTVNTTLGSVLMVVEYGTSKRCSSEPERGDIPVLRIPNVVRGRLNLDDLKWASLTTTESDRFRVAHGDVLVVRTNGNPEYVGRGVVIGEDAPADAVFASYLIRLKTDPGKLDPRFLARLLHTPRFRSYLRPSIRSSAGNYNLNTRGIKSQPIRLPSVDDQRDLLSQVGKIEAALSAVVNERGQARATKHALIRECLVQP